MAERAPDPEPLDRLEAAIAFAIQRAAARRGREANERHAKIVSTTSKRGGRAA
jgi:hypothetical protein